MKNNDGPAGVRWNRQAPGFITYHTRSPEDHRPLYSVNSDALRYEFRLSFIAGRRISADTIWRRHSISEI